MLGCRPTVIFPTYSRLLAGAAGLLPRFVHLSAKVYMWPVLADYHHPFSTRKATAHACTPHPGGEPEGINPYPRSWTRGISRQCLQVQRDDTVLLIQVRVFYLAL